MTNSFPCVNCTQNERLIIKHQEAHIFAPLSASEINTDVPVTLAARAVDKSRQEKT